MKRLLILTSFLLVCACSDQDDVSAYVEPAHGVRPNILLVVVDDLGYSDLGSFGGEIPTPNIDRLAMDGIRFSNFHGAPMCSPSRAMMLTGVDSHPAGFGNMLEELSPNQKGQAGYEGYLSERVVTVSTLLHDAGYRTYLSGKWHLGSGPVAGPAARGFDRSFALDSGGASHFSDMQPAYAPSPDVKANYWEDGEKLAELPPDFEYSSQFFVDRMIDYLSEEDDMEQPFFAYLSFTAPHWPLQAPDDAIALQAGRYDEGYDVVATRRLARLRDMGLVPPNAVRSGRSPKEMPWIDLDDEHRKIEIRAMEVYAAMIVEVDEHMGRLIDYMDSNGLMDNTVIIFLSDNGPEGHDLDETWGADMFPEIRKVIDATHDFSFENMGRPDSYTLLGPNWANAASPSSRLHKGFPTEGGTHVAAFVHDPARVKHPAIIDDFVFIKDVAPTILELAGVRQPGNHYKSQAVEPITGLSFTSLLGDSRKDDEDRVIGIELMGKRAIRSGAWKLLHMPPPYGTNEWQLFNLAQDPSESADVADAHPDVVKDLQGEWIQYAEKNKVVLPDWVSGY